MRVKLICCDVFLRITSALVAASPHTIDVEYVPMLAHNNPDKLRAELQARINATLCKGDSTARNYDLLLLLYGLCGNAAVGLTSPIKMIIPRVHDCCTMFMGSRERFLQEFGNNLSMRWCSSGYYERSYIDKEGEGKRFTSGEALSFTSDCGFSHVFLTNPEYLALAEQYGEDNAQYIWQTLHPEIETPEAAYIRIDGHEVPGYEDGFKRQVEAQGKTMRVLKGSTAYLKAMINGPWDNTRFLTVDPGEKICAVYDMEQVLKAGV